MKKYLSLLILFFGCANVFGHGENKYGPNGGYIKMPGVFHTELVFDKKDNSFQLFLLDIQFKNPTVKNSSVSATFEDKKIKINFKCNVSNANHFKCQPDQKYESKSGKLRLEVVRDGAKGVAEYQFPLKLMEQKDPSNHSNHH